ncbi:unnamed protein product [Gordionus sp. m RMFG-2023]
MQKSSNNVLNKPFRTPLKRKRVSQNIEELEKELNEIEEKIKEFIKIGYKLDKSQIYMNLLHEYNDIKDIGLKIFGELARYKGVTIKEIYKTFDMDIVD